MKTIDIYSAKADRKSHFTVDGEKLVVSGNLPHGYEFEPAGILAAAEMIEYLTNWIEDRRRDG